MIKEKGWVALTLLQEISKITLTLLQKNKFMSSCKLQVPDYTKE